ncbi:hypothetical protein OAJ73_02890 [Gammaproteobacteria bacterium]|nr:hypothetical protein [Gammaproteobacteria bacterium]
MKLILDLTRERLTIDDALALSQKGEILAQLSRIKRGHSSYHLPRFGQMLDWTTGSCFHVNGGKMSNAF